MKKVLKTIGIIVISIVMVTVIGLCVLICSLEKSDKKEIPDDLYIKTSEINDTKSLIGLSEEEVIELLGKPIDRLVDKTHLKNYTYYTYDGGYTYKSFLGNTYGKKWYDFIVLLDENGTVKYTYMKECP